MWSADHARSNGANVDYRSIGSGGGTARIEAATVDSGARDNPLDSKELAKQIGSYVMQNIE